VRPVPSLILESNWGLFLKLEGYPKILQLSRKLDWLLTLQEMKIDGSTRVCLLARVNPEFPSHPIQADPS
jgi:hypothetical protein